MDYEDGIKNRLKAMGIPTYTENVYEWETIERDLRAGNRTEDELQEAVAAEMTWRHAPKPAKRKSKWTKNATLNRIDDDEIGSSIIG